MAPRAASMRARIVLGRPHLYSLSQRRHAAGVLAADRWRTAVAAKRLRKRPPPRRQRRRRWCR
jgi:hypothetical protein